MEKGINAESELAVLFRARCLASNKPADSLLVRRVEVEVEIEVQVKVEARGQPKD
jgi:hypothetical protein